MKTYLIVKCTPLSDPYECDANREPMFITNSIDELNLDYDYEIYECIESKCIKIKEYDEYEDEGMAFYYWDIEDDPEEVKPTIVEKYPNKTRNNKIPNIVKQYMVKGTEVDDSLRNCGTIAFFFDSKYYVYGEYYGFHYPTGY